ncbi:SpoIIE family protein phosphatase [Streptomyces sp. LX-29]|uniref:SpoIIE family protein phosphatase n=1 Tax=Streptomyces sp. LX-29 TaxID=2900152 RepID=UPI00240CF808|nr:SpoIIE family protein phosphatase [Streptomyces sp. LX-29]WFB10923.1 SpoIIE family protein phosphatase [Streptomyces sp. LX-29]
MAERRATSAAESVPDDWPARPELSLALNRMGCFDWDLDSGLMYVDPPALGVLGMTADQYDGHPSSLGRTLPTTETARLDAVVSQALKDGSERYSTYVRVRHEDGEQSWVHTQATIQRDETGRPYRIIGIFRDAPGEPGGESGRPDLAEERIRVTSVVERVTAILAHARTVPDVIDVLNDARALGHLGLASVILGLVEGGRIHIVAEGQLGQPIPEFDWTGIDDPFPMSEVVRTLKPRFIETRQDFATSYPVLWPHLDPLGVSRAAYLPLIAQGRPIATLGLLYKDKEGFGAEERNLIVTLGTSIAQGLQRAMLFEQEHDLAEGLQQAMLPRRIPAIPGTHIAVRYRSARIGRDIGGDWYDVIPLPGGRVGVAVGDVQGHDTHASAVMGQLRIVLRAYAAEGHSPSTVMARASIFLHELDTDRFATCAYGEVDPPTGMVHLVRAGHIDPLLRHTDGTCRRLPLAGGLPLGLSAEFRRLEYPVTTVELDPGETLLMCTDGLVEVPGADLDDGIQQLTQIVRDGPYDIQQLAEKLCAVVEDRGGEDDMALLLLRRRGTDVPQSSGKLQQHVAQGDPDALSSARHMIRAALRAWGAGERTDDIELVADELMTNALLHTDGPAVVTVRMLTGYERRLRVEVEDTSSTLPRRREAGESGVSGRGLLLVDRLADVWGVESRGGGKVVWCEFVCPPRAAGQLSRP